MIVLVTPGPERFVETIPQSNSFGVVMGGPRMPRVVIKSIELSTGDQVGLPGKKSAGGCVERGCYSCCFRECMPTSDWGEFVFYVLRSSAQSRGPCRKCAHDMFIRNSIFQRALASTPRGPPSRNGACDVPGPPWTEAALPEIESTVGEGRRRRVSVGAWADSPPKNPR